MLTRRHVVTAALTTAAAALGGCSILRRPIPKPFPDDPRYSNPCTPLTIDTHCHVFNGSDIQVERFITLVRARNEPILKDLGEILQHVSWAVAPSGREEMAALREVNKQLSSTGVASNAEQIANQYGRQQHERGVEELNNALGKVERARTAEGRLTTQNTMEIASAIQNIPKDYSEYRALLQSDQRLKGSKRDSLHAAIVFALRQFQYRYVSVVDYLAEYSSRPRRKVDLIVCHLLDFDWALAQGAATETSLREQVDVMEEISILTGGRVHSFVPFDPMRQVAYELGHSSTSSLDLVKDAVLSRGFLGVKMYPPMGFAPMGNADQPAKLWQQPWIAAQLQRPDLGPRLDRVLLQLYEWCLANNVPIMAHTSSSNLPTSDFEHLTKAVYWQGVPPGLTATFGHFGDTELGSKRFKRAEEFAALMDPQGGHGAGFYADSGYFTHAVTDPPTLESALRKVFRATRHRGPAALAQRLMYGSDWSMLIIEGGNTAGYLETFQKIISELDGDPSLGAAGKLSDRFFALNAVEHLSLRSGKTNSTRSRLDAFYAAKSVPTPQWAAKVDRLPRAGEQARADRCPA